MKGRHWKKWKDDILTCRLLQWPGRRTTCWLSCTGFLDRRRETRWVWLYYFLKNFFASGVGFPHYPEILYMGRCRTRTRDLCPEGWCANDEPPHPLFYSAPTPWGLLQYLFSISDLLCDLPSLRPHCGERGGIIIWSGPGGWIVLRRVAGVHCVHYIEQKDCTARFATGGIWEIPD